MTKVDYIDDTVNQESKLRRYGRNALKVGKYAALPILGAAAGYLWADNYINEFIDTSKFKFEVNYALNHAAELKTKATLIGTGVGVALDGIVALTTKGYNCIKRK